MNCYDIMKKALVTLEPSDSVKFASQLMFDSNVGFLPVTENGRAIGILTDRDIALRLVRQEKSYDTPVSDIMTQEVVSCSPYDSVECAADLMAENQVSRLLLNDENGQLVGVLSLSDLPKVNAEKAVETLRGVSEREAPSPI